MFKNSSKILFLLILMSGSMMTVSANSWLGAWMGLEINLLSFIPLMNDLNNLTSTEASLKYFLTQALASSVLLLGIIMYMMKYNLINQMSFNEFNINLIMISSLLLKSGTAPFHFWFPGIMEGLSWMNSLILMTWQKIAPLMLISYFTNSMFILTIPIILSIIIGSLGGLNQVSLRKIMAFSSINHLGWMMASMWSNENLWLIYFLFYSFLSITLILLFNNFKLFSFNQLFSSFFSNKIIKFSMMMNLLSLGGLPPFLGFIPKWLTIQYLSMNNHLFLMSILTVMTLITLFFYLRMCFSAFMLNYYENNWIYKIYWNKKITLLYLSCSFISLMGFPMISLLYFIM
uniref:NADH-ubiquinone oxidoreductase chain 2 n=1 Tax=Microphor holosericeus TaxID=2498633 RepID=A0A7G7CE21_9MUSC|nr:NADH dehydrogenase subunit 2 [Microphor holosericeus]